MANKTKATAKRAAAFIDAVANRTRREDAKVLVRLMQKATGEKPVMWGPSIVGFGARHYIYESGHEGDTPLVGFSPRASASVLYLGLGAGGYEKLLAKLGKHKAGKGCLYIGSLADVDLDVLERLIAKSVAAARKKAAA
ncbi:MAG TPA: DUF1801 domain-containing protein [Rhizomicrobium sp.]|nr:DUF1801 domain-containing protein [Rhizomicrobium sp.]